MVNERSVENGTNSALNIPSLLNLSSGGVSSTS